MKLQLKKSAVALAAAALVSPVAMADVTVGVDDSTAPWLGFMNVFELPSNGGAFVFNSGWGVADLTADFDDGASTLTLGPNTINDPDPFWYTPAGGPGSTGNKFMEANLFQQVDDAFGGMTVTFEGTILSDTFTQAHTASIFIRDFAPDFSSFNETFVPANVGDFSISLATDPGAGRHVQWGFQVLGENVWSTDVGPFGNMVIATPAPAGAALLGLGGLVATRRRR